VTENPISVQNDGFDVRLRRSGRNVAAPPGETILDALHDAGVNVSFAFTEGETKVIVGILTIATLSSAMRKKQKTARS